MGNKLEIRVDTKDIKKRRRKPTTIPQRRPLDPKRPSIKRDPKKPSIKDLRLKNFSDDMSSTTNQDMKGPLVIFETDGQEFKFEPGRIIVFDSKEFHTGEEPESETFNWLRLTANIVLSHE